jgi:hypothetical protein
MQEDYFLYYEEIDWAMRARGRYSLGYAPGSIVFHKAGTTSYKAMPLFAAKFYYRNRIRFAARFFPGRMAAVKRSLVMSILRSAAKGRWELVRLLLGILMRANEIRAAVAPQASQKISASG